MSLAPYDAELSRDTPDFFAGSREAPLSSTATAVNAAGVRSALCGWITPQNVVRSLVGPKDLSLLRANSKLFPVLKLFNEAGTEIAATGTLFLGVRPPGADAARVIGRKPYRPHRQLTIAMQQDDDFRQRLGWDFDTGDPSRFTIDLPGGYSVELFIVADIAISFSAAALTTIVLPVLEARAT